MACIKIVLGFDVGFYTYWL